MNCFLLLGGNDQCNNWGHTLEPSENEVPGVFFSVIK